MLTSTKSKLEDSRVILDQLREANDTPSFKASFNSFLNSARAITYALQKDCRDILGFNEWYAMKQEEMRDDELLRFIHEARTEDFHKGKHRLIFPSTHIRYFSSNQAGSPPSPNAKIVIGAEGPFWLIDEGTPRQRRIPLKQGVSYVTKISITNAPTQHRGKTLSANDPLTICQLALDYLSELVHEAVTQFGS